MGVFQHPARALRGLSQIRFPADITDSRLVNDTDTGPIAAQLPLGKIGLSRTRLLSLPFDRFSALQTVQAFLRRLRSTFRAEEARQGLVTVGTLHLFLFHFKIFEKPIDVAFVSFHISKEPLALFVREQPVKVVLLPGEKAIEIDLFRPLLLRGDLLSLRLFLVHKTLLYIGYVVPFVNPEKARLQV
jgi:hypothetical protein